MNEKSLFRLLKLLAFSMPKVHGASLILWEENLSRHPELSRRRSHTWPWVSALGCVKSQCHSSGSLAPTSSQFSENNPPQMCELILTPQTTTGSSLMLLHFPFGQLSIRSTSVFISDPQHSTLIFENHLGNSIDARGRSECCLSGSFWKLRKADKSLLNWLSYFF